MLSRGAEEDSKVGHGGGLAAYYPHYKRFVVDARRHHDSHHAAMHAYLQEGGLRFFGLST